MGLLLLFCRGEYVSALSLGYGRNNGSLALKEKEATLSYTPEEQVLEPACHELMAAIDRFCAVVTARIQAPKEWDKVHLHEISQLAADLVQIRLRVANEC